jgi:hypothetical protein
MQPTNEQAEFYLGFVDYAYAMYGQDGTNLTPPTPSDFPTNYQVVTYLNAVDPISDTRVFFGFLAYATDGSAKAVLAIRGTYNLVEWINDVDVYPVPFAPIPNSFVASGFDKLYSTVGWINVDGTQFDLRSRLAASATGVVVAGHSLGGALGTMLISSWLSAFPILNDGISIITAASPAVGDGTFAAGFNNLVQNSARFINVLDSVAGSLDWIYTQVNGYGIELGPSWDVVPSPGCEHSLNTYLWLLEPGGCSALGDCCWADATAKKNLQTVVEAKRGRRAISQSA